MAKLWDKGYSVDEELVAFTTHAHDRLLIDTGDQDEAVLAGG